MTPAATAQNCSRNCGNSLEPGDSRSYLRAAQAYMLISMPTDTSTIFGAFQAIRELPTHGTIAVEENGTATPKLAQARGPSCFHLMPQVDQKDLRSPATVQLTY